MTGPKLNEKSFVAGERSGTKASALYIRASASKARVVLDLIRGLPVRQADEVLQFTDRDMAVTIRKVLASAVANAVHNDEQDPEELYVKACFADEGPTLKRFTPRARGRAGRIKKRTCHITIVVARLDDARLEIVQARDAKRSASGRRRGAAVGGAASRRDRVARSRARAQELKTGTSAEGSASDEAPSSEPTSETADDLASETNQSVTETIVDDVAAESTESVDTDATEAADAVETSEETESSEPDSGTADDDASETK